MQSLIHIKELLEEGVQQVNHAVDLLDAYIVLHGGAVTRGTNSVPPPPLRMIDLDSLFSDASPVLPPTFAPGPAPSPAPRPTPPSRDRSPRRSPSSPVATPFGAITTKTREQWSATQTEELIELLAQGLPFAEIGRRIGKTAEQCQNKIKNLKKKHRFS